MDKYIKVYDWMYDIFGGDTTAVLIYALIYHFTAASGGCHSSYQQIAERLKITRMTVHRKLTKMIETGIVSRDEKGTLTATEKPRNLYQNVTTENDGLYQNVTGSCNKMLQNCNKMLHPSRIIRNISKDNHLYIGQNGKKDEAEKKPKRKAEAAAQSAAKEADETILKSFEEFWKAYPRKVGKPAALKAYKKFVKDPTTAEVIMNGLNRIVEDDFQYRENEYIPHPSTWLNREGWNDEAKPPKAKNRKAAHVPDYIYQQERGEYDTETATPEEVEEILKHMED